MEFEDRSGSWKVAITSSQKEYPTRKYYTNPVW